MPSLDETNRAAMNDLIGEQLEPGEAVVAMLPFATARKRPKGPEGKVSAGVWQSARLHRPLTLTDRTLYVFDAGRTPHVKRLHSQYSRDGLRVVSVVEKRFGARVVTVTIPGEGDVPFEVGTFDDLELLVASLPPA